MSIASRSWSSGAGYRYGFNGKEKDGEGIGGGGSTYDYGFRIYNPQIARFLSTDPLSDEYPWNSTYAFAENDVIRSIDLEGAEKLIVITNITDGKSTQLFRGSPQQLSAMEGKRNLYSMMTRELVSNSNNSDGILNITSGAVKRIHRNLPSGQREEYIQQHTYTYSYSKEGKEYKESGTFDVSIHQFDHATLQDIATGIVLNKVFSVVVAPIIKRAIQAGSKIAQNMSLGLKNGEQLKNFSSEFDNAPYMDEWLEKGLRSADAQSFDVAFQQATTKVLNTGGRIKFNLTGFDIKKAVSMRGKGLYDKGVGYTDWEFNQVLGNKKLLNATDFYRNGVKVSTNDIIKEAALK